MQPHRHRYKIGERGAVLGIVTNAVLAIFKFIAGILGHSNAMLADALHTASDLFTSAVIYIGFKIAQVPPDEHHPYGHARAESIAAKIVSLILIALGIKVLLGSLHIIAIHRFYRPGLIALVAAVVSIIVKYALFCYVHMLGKRIKSTSLIADAYHHRSDVLSSIAVLVGISAARLGLKFMDPLAGMLVAGLVIKTGINTFHTAYDELMDAAPPKELKEEIEKAVIATPDVKAVKELNVRKHGIDLYIDLIIDVDKDISVKEGHLVTIKVKRNIMKSVPGAKRILIHVEPYIEE
ncbi:MAG: cation transporter [Candidatus Omnitrophica bacterium]|nr:cation transporter [Candidatus Omnitrophota bacterium]